MRQSTSTRKPKIESNQDVTMTEHEDFDVEMTDFSGNSANMIDVESTDGKNNPVKQVHQNVDCDMDEFMVSPTWSLSEDEAVFLGTDTKPLAAVPDYLSPPISCAVEQNDQTYGNVHSQCNMGDQFTDTMPFTESQLTGIRLAYTKQKRSPTENKSTKPINHGHCFCKCHFHKCSLTDDISELKQYLSRTADNLALIERENDELKTRYWQLKDEISLFHAHDSVGMSLLRLFSILTVIAFWICVLSGQQ